MSDYVIENRKLVRYIGNDIDLIIPTGVETLATNCFAKNERIQSVCLPESVTEIGAGAFAGCSNLALINMPEGIHTIGEGAFISCTSLREIYLPSSLRTIGKMAFCNSGLAAVYIPGSVVRIARNAFYKCHNLQKVQITNPDACIEEDVFGICHALREGFIAPGYPRERCKEDRVNDDLRYSILWCTCIEMHSKKTCERAEALIRGNMEIVMEDILRQDNVAAFSGLLSRGLAKADIIDQYIKNAVLSERTALTALMLKGIEHRGRNREGEFAL